MSAPKSRRGRAVPLIRRRRDRLARAVRRAAAARAAAAAVVAASTAGCAFEAPAESVPRSTLFIGIDVSGSFRASGHFNDAIVFAAHYLHGRLSGMGGLDTPRALFVGSVGGDEPGQAQAFHPIHDFAGKSTEQIEADLRDWFPPNDRLTDFNAFFRRAADLVQRQNLTLAPITLVIFSDGVPDVAEASARRLAPDDPERYASIDLSPLEYLARNVTLRVLYPEPPVAVAWERYVERNRVRIWTVDHVVMRGWREQLQPDSVTGSHADLAAWIQDNIDFRVRRSVF